MTETTLGSLVKSGALRLGDGYRTKRSELAESGYRIIRVADVTDGCVDLSSPDFVDAAYAKAIGDKAAVEGDVLLTTKGTVGRVAVMPATTELAAYSPQLCFFRVLDPQRIDPRFVRYWFSSAEFWNQARDRMNNTDMAAYINLADVRSMSVTLPPLPAQRAIAEVLGALDDKIAANTRTLELLNELAAAEVALLTSSTTVPLSTIAHITMGSSPAGEDLNVTSAGIPFYQGVRDFGMRFPSYRVWTERPQRLAEPGDTLLSVRAPVGRVNIARDTSCIGRGVASVRSKTGSPFTLFHLLAANDEAWLPFESEGTVFGSINRRQLESVPVPVVPESSASDLERRLTSIETRLAGATLENERLAATRDALLPALMSGRLRVKDAEKVVSDAV